MHATTYYANIYIHINRGIYMCLYTYTYLYAYIYFILYRAAMRARLLDIRDQELAKGHVMDVCIDSSFIRI